MTPLELYDAVVAALAELPKTADGIAAMLETQGIIGDHNCTTCPLAVWLSRKVRATVKVTSTRCGFRHSVDSLTLPPAAVRFVARYDGRTHYRQLDVAR